MSNPLMPSYMFRTYDEVTPAFLASIGAEVVLADIDNTLAPYEQAEPDERLLAWVTSLGEAGISLAFVSNNNRERVERFNRTIGAPAFWKSGKPSRKSLARAMAAAGGTTQNTVMLGDQLLTDALAAYTLGIPSIIVPPIRDKRNAFFRFKRLLERPTVRKFKRTNQIDW